eukprot:UN30423
MNEKRENFMKNYNHLSKLLMREPRGYPCQNVDYIVAPTNKKAKFGFIIAEQNSIYPLMSGHNTICVVTALLETGMVPMKDNVEFWLEAPGGMIKIKAQCKNNKVLNVTLQNVPAFVGHIGITVKVPEIGDVKCDVTYGGMWYCIVDAESVKLKL